MTEPQRTAGAGPEELADLAWMVDCAVQQIATASHETIDRARDGRAILSELKPRVEKLVAHEAAEMAALGQQRM
jgi:hypothetical protein